MPNITITMNQLDSYGDGWNDAYVRIYDSGGAEVAAHTLEAGASGSDVFQLEDNASYTWSFGGGNWVSEASFTLVDENGVQLAAAAGQSAGGTLGNGQTETGSFDLGTPVSDGFLPTIASELGEFAAISGQITLTANYTINIWVKNVTLPGQEWSNLYLQNSGYKYILDANYGAIGAGTGPTRLAVSASDPLLVADTFHLVTCVFDGTTIEYYVNGYSIGSTTPGGAAPTVIDVVNGPGGQNFATVVKDLRLYDMVATAQQVLDSYSTEGKFADPNAQGQAQAQGDSGASDTETQEEAGPIDVEGYYPIYNTEAGADAASPDGSGSHSHVLGGSSADYLENMITELDFEDGMSGVTSHGSPTYSVQTVNGQERKTVDVSAGQLTLDSMIADYVANRQSTDQMTISFWFKHNGTDAWIVSDMFGIGGGTQSKFRLTLDGRFSSLVRINIGLIAMNEWYPATGGIQNNGVGMQGDPLSHGQWHHVSMVYDETLANGSDTGDVTLYFDGVKTVGGMKRGYGGLGTDGLDDLVNAAFFCIGGRSTGDQVFNGELSHFVVHGRALSEAEITELMGALPGAAAGTTYYMPNGLTMGVNQFHGDYVSEEADDSAPPVDGGGDEAEGAPEYSFYLVPTVDSEPASDYDGDGHSPDSLGVFIQCSGGFDVYVKSEGAWAHHDSAFDTCSMLAADCGDGVLVYSTGGSQAYAWSRSSVMTDSHEDDDDLVDKLFMDSENVFDISSTEHTVSEQNPIEFPGETCQFAQVLESGRVSYEYSVTISQDSVVVTPPSGKDGQEIEIRLFL